VLLSMTDHYPKQIWYHPLKPCVRTARTSLSIKCEWCRAHHKLVHFVHVIYFRHESWNGTLGNIIVGDMLLAG